MDARWRSSHDPAAAGPQGDHDTHGPTGIEQQGRQQAIGRLAPPARTPRTSMEE